ncbi:hypothetical protein PJ15_2859 [Acinetobacter sp. neg1]|nr:hypothetical protein PJ15_2859 [Acinetobacter sp. neg1]
MGCNHKANDFDLPKMSENITILGFEDQKTDYNEIIKTLGKPHKVVSFSHRENIEYTLAKNTYCFYLDGSGLIWSTDSKACSHKESFLPLKSLTSPLPDKKTVL